MIRKVVIVAIAIAIVFGSVIVSRKLAESKKLPQQKAAEKVATVFATTVTNGDVAVWMNVTGPLKAKNRVELFSEVQGMMQPDGGRFKEGTQFGKGQVLVEIRSDDFKAGLMAQKSNLQNLVTAMLADIRMDFPESLDRWNGFLNQMNTSATLPALPEPVSDKERLFVTGRNVYSSYYNIQNSEHVHSKYRLVAPFSGIVTMSAVTPGTVVRPGQKLGEFIDPAVFELEAAVSASVVNYIKVGQVVKVHAAQDSDQHWKGTVSRINRLVDNRTQTVTVFIEVNGSGLEEGMFLSAEIGAGKLTKAFEIPRAVVFDSDQVYIVQDSVLVQQTVEPLYFNEKTVVVRGLADGSTVLTKMAPGAYAGMKVRLFKQN
jgi:membrane fusion protein (multidrug efflux system)